MQMVAGVDEVGRGPLAGPVIAAAVILHSSVPNAKDSKKLSPQQRKLLVPIIKQNAVAFAFGRAETNEIDVLNIHFATLLAMQRAVENLSISPHEVWVDGKFAPLVSMPCRTFIKGDENVGVISCASILAKVLRDQEMEDLDKAYPVYGFKQHKGYPTALHLKNLMIYGPCPIHRLSFGPVSKVYGTYAKLSSS